MRWLCRLVGHTATIKVTRLTVEEMSRRLQEFTQENPLRCTRCGEVMPQ